MSSGIVWAWALAVAFCCLLVPPVLDRRPFTDASDCPNGVCNVYFQTFTECWWRQQKQQRRKVWLAVWKRQSRGGWPLFLVCVNSCD
uniref:Putative secreted protein n=1 Tax=Anopheles darlingi TaxID=43151 RepID=A0A2M4DCB6_ANODA